MSASAICVVFFPKSLINSRELLKRRKPRKKVHFCFGMCSIRSCSGSIRCFSAVLSSLLFKLPGSTAQHRDQHAWSPLLIIGVYMRVPVVSCFMCDRHFWVYCAPRCGRIPSVRVNAVTALLSVLLVLRHTCRNTYVFYIL